MRATAQESHVGISGQHQVTDQLRAQQITFPTDTKTGLPTAQAGYAGQHVTTAAQAKAFSDMIETHFKQATGGRTYSQLSAQYMAASADKTTPAATLIKPGLTSNSTLESQVPTPPTTPPRRPLPPRARKCFPGYTMTRAEPQDQRPSGPGTNAHTSRTPRIRSLKWPG